MPNEDLIEKHDQLVKEVEGLREVAQGLHAMFHRHAQVVADEMKKTGEMLDRFIETVLKIETVGR